MKLKKRNVRKYQAKYDKLNKGKDKLVNLNQRIQEKQKIVNERTN